MPAWRRGECPTLQRPMPTGDGLLARLRPVDNILTLPQLRALAIAAQRFGNGIVEITARGSLQIRGLKPETVAPFEDAVLQAGIRISTGVGIETPPLAGLDTDELIDVRPIAGELRLKIAAHRPELILAPKLAITLDGGGRFHLAHVSADIKITAFRDGDLTKFLLAVGGTNKSARPVAIVDEVEMVDTLIGLLEKLAAMGPEARGKDIDLQAIAAPRLNLHEPPLVGLVHHDILGIAFAHRQADAASLIAFAGAAEALGAGDVRLAPCHGFFVTGLSAGEAGQLQRFATTLGFLTEPADPRRNIALCAGSRGCASAFYDTRDLAARIMAQAPDLLDGSFDVHLSGCPKGCAHPAPSVLTLVGARAGYGLVVNGAASKAPATYIADNDINTALLRLQALVRQSKEDGESVSACLTRLGAGEIAAALRMDGT
ncbi:MAG: precorrin-3B synthase [Rhizobium sp.]|nr:precorrin-3B synthase [Rhizobium sp.]